VFLTGNSRYGTPEAAWEHEQQFGWYQNGGVLGAGQVGIVGEAGPEVIQGGRTGATVTPVSGRAPITVNFYGTSWPTPEQQQALMMRLSAAVGVS
jgi:hypothetical protein